jgi:tryptophanyl-tRNA synthetase
MEVDMTKPTILTGIRANNDLHIGNYFGAMLPMVDMATTRVQEFQINFFIPDLHSFTTPIDHHQLYRQILHNARLFAAAGLPLDNDDIAIYRQSYVPAHSELTWILDCFTGYGEMSRMTQFKDKSRNLQKDLTSQAEGEPNSPSLHDSQTRISVGLFNYPVLMAADMLLYNAEYVPVGDDQTQHLEFTRDIAERMNNRFGNIFTVPKPVKEQHNFFGKDQGLRIKDLQNPSKKMSKSDDTGKGVIFLGDYPEAAAKKIMSAATDDKANIQFNPASQPGISNLLEILALLRGEQLEHIINEFEGQSRYGDFKRIIAIEMEQFLRNFQARLNDIDDVSILKKLTTSEQAMNHIANATLLRAQQAVGLRPKEQ